MAKLKSIRSIDELGRIVIPAEVRIIMDWTANTAVEVWMNEASNEVLLKTHADACIYCGAKENLKEFKKRRLCPDCQSGILKLN